MYSPAVLDHFQNPRNVGDLPGGIAVEASNPVCGDILRLSLLLQDGRVSTVRFKAKGCVASIAAGSALTEMMLGRTLPQLAQLQAESVSEALGGLPPESGHAAALAIDTLRLALQKGSLPAPAAESQQPDEAS